MGFDHDEQAKFNEKQFAETGGLLKAIPCRDIEYSLVSGSRTAISIANGGVPCAGLHAELCNEEGHFDKNNVLQRCPLCCNVVRRELEDADPEMPELLSEAGN